MKSFMRMWRMDIRICPYVICAEFYGVYRLGHIMIDCPLITCLVKRWRPEIHKFHVPFEEMMITLQDVAIILGLRIDGPSVTGTCVLDVAELYRELSLSPHSLMLSKDLLSPSGGYVTSYPPQHLMQMRWL